MAMDWLSDRETLLEIGIVVFMGLIVGGLVMLAGGQVFERVSSAIGNRSAPPNRGKVPPSRHRGTASAAPR